MLKPKRNRIVFLGLGAFVIFIWLGIKVINGFSENQKALDQLLPSVFTLTSEDSSLIGPKYKKKFRVIEVRRSKVRNPISLLSFDSTYSLIIHKINLANDESLKKVIRAEMSNANSSTGYTYNIIDNNLYKFRYMAGSIGSVSMIDLTMSGDSLQKIADSDSVLSYHLLCKNLSIKYEKESPVDIFVEGQEKAFGKTTLVPMDVLFLKRNRGVYLLILTSNKPEATVPPNLLHSIVSE